MRLLTIEAENYCQFRKFSIRFAPGSTAIIGRNGSGKSNALNCGYAALTGDFGRNDGLKTDNICQFVPATAPSKIRTVIEHSDVIIDIMRGLRPVSVRLKLTSDGQETVITKSQEATDAILNILGVSSRMLADYVFVDQWSIFDFLSMMPAERAKAFQRLFRTERAESLWKYVGEHHEGLVIPRPGIDKDAVINRIAENKEKIATCLIDLRDVVAKLDSTKHQSKRTIVSLWRQKQTLRAEVDKLREEYKFQVGESDKLKKAYDDLYAEWAKLDAYVTNNHERYLQNKQMLGAWEIYNTVDRARANLEEHLDHFNERLVKLVEPTRPDDYVRAYAATHKDEIFWRDYDALAKRVGMAEHFMALLTEAHPHCPTCGTPKEMLEEHKKNYDATIDVDKSTLSVMLDAINNSCAYDKQSMTYETTKAQLIESRFRVVEQLKDLLDVTKPQESELYARANTTEYEKIEKTLRETGSAADLLHRKYNQAEGAHTQLYKELANKIKAYEYITVTAEDAENAREALLLYDGLLGDKATLSANIDLLNQLIRSDEKSLVQLEEVEKRAEIETAWADHTMNMRHVLHRDGLPRVAALNYLELMEEEINSLLVRFDSPFMVTADGDLSFVATFKDGRKVPASRLSGGEKVLLALAFRVVVNDVFAKDLGLLVLDEPTAGLDEANLMCLRVAIERLKELSASRGLQVVMVTHEKELNNMFDHVVEIGKDT